MRLDSVVKRNADDAGGYDNHDDLLGWRVEEEEERSPGRGPA